MENPKFKFEELIVYQKALNFVDDVYSVTRKFPKDELYGLISQYKRAAASGPLKNAKGAGEKKAQVKPKPKKAWEPGKKRGRGPKKTKPKKLKTTKEELKTKKKITKVAKKKNSMQTQLKKKKKKQTPTNAKQTPKNQGNPKKIPPNPPRTKPQEQQPGERQNWGQLGEAWEPCKA
ncbi:four helix bundle protein [Dokdonia sp. PRO95]|uniref:four helix bundle protein n=1 Tax=Dokdonia sp. PRO95 TaxID=1239415 RepID=UPI00054CF0BD|nr:four helix bundle protein [Dokdonia sp. PRO95]